MSTREHPHQHDHGHAHGGHGHSHAPADFNRAFVIGMALNLAFVAAEVFYGLAANSLALLADAGHNLSDVLGLGAAWTGALSASGAAHELEERFGIAHAALQLETDAEQAWRLAPDEVV